MKVAPIETVTLTGSPSISMKAHSTRERSFSAVASKVFGSHAVQQPHELLAAPAREQVGGPQVVRESRGDHLEHGVAGVVTVGVVDDLEVVDVGVEHGAVLVGAGVGQAGLQAGDHAPAVGGAGQRVGLVLHTEGVEPPQSVEECRVVAEGLDRTLDVAVGRDVSGWS